MNEMTLSELLATWVGWQYIQDSDGAWGWQDPEGNLHAAVPDYEHSRDLIADLLPRLSEEQWFKLTDRITQQFDQTPHVRPYSRLFLTLPPAALAAAIWEVVRDK